MGKPLVQLVFLLGLFFSEAVYSSLETYHNEFKSEIYPLYVDDELISLWDSLHDIHHPDKEDYQKIQNYLMYGKRPYLDVLLDYSIEKGFLKEFDRSNIFDNRILQKMNFFDEGQSYKSFNIKCLGGASPNDKSNCIILFTSFNRDRNDFEPGPYVEKLGQMLVELEAAGYRGHVLYRTGGYPMVEKGGLRLVHVPYSFKVLSFLEAFNRGYENVLWLDTSLLPTNNLSEVFSKIKNEGFLLVFNGICLDTDFNFWVPIYPVEAARSAGIKIEELNQIPHVIAGVVGISFRHEKSCRLMSEWLRLTSLTVPAMTLYPEEILLSISSWRTGNRPNGNTWDYFDARSVVPVKPTNAKKPFWFNKG